MNQQTYYSLQEVADELKVAYLTVYRWVQLGKLKAHQVEKQYRVDRADLDTFMEARKTNTTPKLQELNRDELISMIRQLKKQKKYGLVWEDKLEVVAEQCKTELPVLEDVKEKAIIKDSSGVTNLIIEGDNYHSLSVLNYTHKNKIDVIYIDPPYNTGNKDFIYNDRFVDSHDAYRNSKWLSFMDRRLRLAKTLLKDTGSMFISIDDNEIAELKLLCNEVFGKENFIAQLVVQLNPRGRTLDKFFAKTFEYILVYGKNSNNTLIRELEKEEEKISDYKYKDEKGIHRLLELRNRNPVFNRTNRPNLFYAFYASPDGRLSTTRFDGSVEVLPRNSLGEDGCWTWSKKKADAEMNRLVATNTTGKWRIFRKDYLFSETGSMATTKAKALWLEKEINNENGKEILKKLFGKHTFDFPKSVELVKKCLTLSMPLNGTVLDFFSGSGTTAHAMLNMNAEDGGKRAFILCTNNENGIAENICYPRVKKVIEGVNGSPEIVSIPANLRYFKTAFVSKSRVTDDTRRELVKRSTEMICVRENTFEKITDKPSFKIYKDTDHVAGILFNLDAVAEFKKVLQEQLLPAHIYVFSLSNDTYDEDFADLGLDHELCPIPESILEVYRKLFRSKS